MKPTRNFFIGLFALVLIAIAGMYAFNPASFRLTAAPNASMADSGAPLHWANNMDSLYSSSAAASSSGQSESFGRLMSIYGTAPFTYYATTTLQAPLGDLQLEIADTEDTREQGLSDIVSMASTSGMLFVFDKPDSYGFWMKDMRFPLTVVWIDQNKQIIGFSRHLSPDTYPEIFYPPGPIKYALEIDIGVAKSLGVATGTVLKF